MSVLTQILITTSLGCLVGSAIAITSALGKIMISLERIANCASFPRSLDVVVELSQDTEDLLREIRWHRVKKETVRVTEGLGVDGITEGL